MVAKKAVRRHKIHTCTLLWQKKLDVSHVGSELCMRMVCFQPNTNISLVCFRECVWFTAVKPLRLRVKERKMQNERKGKWFPSKTPCHVQLCSGWYHGNHALSPCAGRRHDFCAVIAFLPCWGFGFQCLLRGSDELLKSREERSQTEGGEDVTAAACCLYTTSARNQTVMCD